jgi:four helix bundle protein
LLERLDKTVEEDPIEPTVTEADAILVVFVEGVHVRHPRRNWLTFGDTDGARGLAAMQDYHQPDIWQRSMDYAVRVYEFSAHLPAGERYNLVSQLRRAATSVPLNIAEGCGCATNAEFSRFLSYAYRSLKELATCLDLCCRLHRSLPEATVAALVDEANQISRMTYALMQRLGPGGSDTHDS